MVKSMRQVEMVNRVSSLLAVAIVAAMTGVSFVSIERSATAQAIAKTENSWFSTYREMSSDLTNLYLSDIELPVAPSFPDREQIADAASAFDRTMAGARHDATRPEDIAAIRSSEQWREAYEGAAKRFVRDQESTVSEAERFEARTLMMDAYQSASAHFEEQHEAQFAKASYLSAQAAATERRLSTGSILGGIATLFVLVAVLYSGAMLRRRSVIALDGYVHRLEASAQIDSLTSLGNHRAFYDRLEREIGRAERHARALTLVLIDVDDFKSVNDIHGHKHGDAVLQGVARVLSSTRAHDCAYRIGGDEFALLLPETDAHGGMAAALRILEDVRRELGPQTVSIGVCAFETGLEQQEFYERADAALYASKANGRNTSTCFCDIRDTSRVYSPRMIAAVRDLLQRGTVDVAFQPIWNLDDSTIFAFEALARPDTGGVVSGPAEAFDIAERIHRNTELDFICARSAFKAAAKLSRDVLVFVNVLPETLTHPEFDAGRAARLITSSGVDLSQIVVEVTERRINDVAALTKSVQDLRANGIRVALDDTGSGYAGLEVLSHITFDFVKIDRSIVVNALEEPRARAVLAGVMAIAQEAGSFVIAEGIEHAEQLEFLRELPNSNEPAPRVHGVQGYLLGCPTVGSPNVEAFAPYGEILTAEPGTAPRRVA